MFGTTHGLNWLMYYTCFMFVNCKKAIYLYRFFKRITSWRITFEFFCNFSFDVRGNGVEIGRHWNDGINLGARARFDENSTPEPVLWIESLRDSDQGTYRCRVDFKQAPTKNFKINLNVIGKSFSYYCSSLIQLYFLLAFITLRNQRMTSFAHLTPIKMHLRKMLGSALKDSFVQEKVLFRNSISQAAKAHLKRMSRLNFSSLRS